MTGLKWSGFEPIARPYAISLKQPIYLKQKRRRSLKLFGLMNWINQQDLSTIRKSLDSQGCVGQYKVFHGRQIHRQGAHQIFLNFFFGIALVLLEAVLSIEFYQEIASLPCQVGGIL